jgi:hypothetical protein
MCDHASGAGPDQWRRVRRHLNGHRHELTRAADGLYPDMDRVGPTALLCPAGWVPVEPADLADVTLTWHPEVTLPRVDGTEPQAQAVLPRPMGGTRLADYADALASIDPPRLMENRFCYRLTDVAFGGGGLALAFGPGTYFAGINVGEAVAHEFAAWHMRGAAAPRLADLPLRDLVGNPADLAAREANPAISMLTLRRDRDGSMSFLLHHRDPARVVHGGGLYQVIPVGVFQPSDGTPAALREDFDLWRCAVREYGEELLGLPESRGPGDESWPLRQALSAARRDGSLASYMLGMGVDPLSLATDILAVTVIDAEIFDDVFGAVVAANAEGVVLGHDPACPGSHRAARGAPPDPRLPGPPGSRGFAFTGGNVERFARREAMQAAGAAVLWLAWRHRDRLAAGSGGLAP